MPDNKVLLVIDLQNDYLWDKRKPLFTYATDNAFVRNLVGFSVEGSEGADIYRGVNRVSDLVFDKNYTEVVICGLDECGCVGATARGARKTGVKVIMLTSCIGSRFSEKKVKKQREKLTSLGVIYRYE